ncbi:hypothetical protein SVAN01_02233 [Stagonosporopsis vannaccii]|nr:hypothetical protein SVAN01_02233 [Stagonosporopsis vannaccii]
MFRLQPTELVCNALLLQAVFAWLTWRLGSLRQILAPRCGSDDQSLQDPEAISRDVRWREYKNTDCGRCSDLTCCQQLQYSCISLQRVFHYRPLDATHRLSLTCGVPFRLAAVKHCNHHPRWLVQL